MAARKTQSTPAVDRARSAPRAGFRSRAAPQAGGWSAEVTRTSRALELEEGVFTWRDPQRIAASLARSAEASTRRKSGPFRSAMSMLVFYVNRAGCNLTEDRRRILDAAKAELRRLYGRAT